MASKRNAALEAMIEEATVDAYGDNEQLTGTDDRTNGHAKDMTVRLSLSVPLILRIAAIPAPG